ncbi:histidine phosphatase family protein [Pseudomonas sp. TTU2014-080ASC]|uniref:histidine phosphatase family protein n=1 Tax=Pseudomonas sp. TTU2014-080ASC TaxID=1729724 RepID=UPI0007187BBB|nr:alpha-ribazole phosphatase family protein [Pseudomonas sp. TTU2014-080ASC]KRW58058.1 alpha-ribazole phosphatase [Pseudomonas sp. TTU2014-080ASC]
MSLTLELIRHGESELAGSFRGSTDDPLTDTGWAQLRAAVSEKCRWDHIVTSPLQRCAHFAEELAAARGCSLSYEADLQELHFGLWEGRSSAELMQTEAAALTRFWEDPYAFTPPDGEPLQAFEARIMQALQRLYERHAGQHILAVTHGGVIRLLVAKARGLPRNGLLQVPVGFAQRFQVVLSEKGELKELQ